MYRTSSCSEETAQRKVGDRFPPWASLSESGTLSFIPHSQRGHTIFVGAVMKSWETTTFSIYYSNFPWTFAYCNCSSMQNVLDILYVIAWVRYKRAHRLSMLSKVKHSQLCSAGSILTQITDINANTKLTNKQTCVHTIVCSEQSHCSIDRSIGREFVTSHGPQYEFHRSPNGQGYCRLQWIRGEGSFST